MKKPYNKPGFIENKNVDQPHAYCIINKVNGKIYVGVHNGNNTKAYKGSGTLLKKAYEKHGRGSFEKVILKDFATVEQAYAYEAQVVNEAFVSRKDNYNIRVGGFGGFDKSAREGYKEWSKDNPEFYSSQKKKALKAASSPNSVNKQKLTCPHCGMTSNVPNMKRYHMDKCKHKSSK